MSSSRVARGRKTQRILADHLKQWWPYAESRGAFEQGDDLMGVPYWCEVKATSDGPITGALKQLHARHADDHTPKPAFVVWRPNGYGPERIGDWVFAMRLEDGINLLREARY